MAEEKRVDPNEGEEKLLEDSPTAQEMIKEIEDPDVDASQISVDWALTQQIQANQALQNEIQTTINGIEVSFRQTIQELSEDKSPQDAMLALEDKVRRIREQKGKSWATDWIFNLIEAGMLLFKDFWLLGEYAKIVGEKSRLQPLRKLERPLLLDLQNSITYFHRHPQDKSSLFETLQRQGYKDTDIERIIDANIVIPQAQDVIRFGVREVYNDRIVKLFGLDIGLSEIEPNARPDVERTGMPWDEFRKYWRAHWVLPGPSQAFEMLHRGQIDMDTLRTVLRAADFMPNLIEPLIQIAFNPLTRVDVRRMHKLGVLGRDAVKKSYKDLGYDETNADLMTDFTVEFNKPKDKDEKVKERDLTKNDILKAYKDGYLTEVEAKEMLIDLLYSKDEAQFLLDRMDYFNEQERINQYLRLYKKAYLRGLFQDIDLDNKLDELSLPSEYKKRLIDLWTIERDIKTELPTKPEVLSWFKKDIIGENQARIYLANLGYVGILADNYIAASQGKTNGN